MFLIVLMTVVAFDYTLADYRVTCRNEKSNEIDWFINYKLPNLDIKGEDSFLDAGSAYAYLVSNSKLQKWRLSQKSIDSSASMIGQTLQYYYSSSNKTGLSYIFYNDELPDDEESSSSVGHTKGVVMFGLHTGFWLIHSIPKFPSAKSYKYPSSGYDNGQSVLCVTFSISYLNEIGKQLIFTAPNIYASGLSSEIEHFLDSDVKTLFGNNPASVRKAPLFRITTLKSKRNLQITSFAKDNQYHKDLYSGLIAPQLNSSLYVETWRRGSGTPLDPSCGLKYDVLDVQSIGMVLKNGSRTIGVEFEYTKDHSKWAISQNAETKWVCIGDINRMLSQERRAGGSACFISVSAWSAFKSAIDSSDSCEVLPE